MSFKDAINSFHLEYSKLHSKPEYSSLAYDLPSLELIYQNSLKSIAEFENIYLEASNDTIDIIKNYDNSILKNNDKFQHDKENYEAIFRFNTDNISSDLKNKLNEINQQNISIEDKEYLNTIKHRDIVNNIDINKNLTNLGFQGYEPDIHRHYNQMMIQFNKNRETDNNQSHAKTSKDIYILSETTNKKIDEITEQINNTKKSISVINDEIALRKNRNNNLVLDEDIKFNELIDNTTKKYNSEKNLNNIQSNIEIDSLNENLNQITEKYNSLRQKISNDLQKKFEILDNQIDTETLEYNKLLEDFYSSYSLKRYQLEKQYNDTIYLNNELVSNNTFSKKMNKYQERNAKKVFFQYDKLMKKKENEIIKSYQRNTNILKNNKYVLDNDRKYKLALLEIDEKIERHQVLNSIQYAKLEQKEYEKIIENNLSIEANKNRISSENLKLSFNIDFKKFELNIKSGLFQLERKLANLNSHKEYLISFLDNTIEAKQKIDNNKKRLNDLLAILNIEKYKNLVKYNQGLITSELEKTNLLHDFDVANYQNVYDKEKALLALNKELNSFSSDYYKKDAELSKNHELLEFKHNTLLLNENLYFSIEESKLKLKVKKLKVDYKVFNGLLTCLENVLRGYTIYLTNLLKNIVNFPLKNEIKQEYIKKIILIFNNLYDDYSNQANILIQKLINDRISFNIGNSYNDEITEVNNEHKENENKINDNLQSLNETISRYKATIYAYYKDINLLKTKLEAVKNTISNQNIRIIKKEIKDKTLKINNITSKIKALEDQISNIPQKKQINEAITAKSLAKINEYKQADLAPFNQIITKYENIFDLIEQKIEYLVDFSNGLNFNQKNIINILNKACTSINKAFMNISKALKNIISNSYNIELNIIEDLYKNASLSHNSKLNVINKNYEKSQKLLERKIKTNNMLNFEKQIENKNQIALIEKKYIQNSYSNIDKKKSKEIELIEKNNKHKEDFMKVFNACDENSSSIRESIIKEIKAINHNYDLSIVELDNIKNNNLKLHDKALKQNNFNRKKHMAILPKYEKIERKKITDEYKLKNIQLDSENKIIYENLKDEKKKFYDENENYKKIQQKEKIKLSKQYSISNKLLRRKSSYN